MPEATAALKIAIWTAFLSGSVAIVSAMLLVPRRSPLVDLYENGFIYHRGAMQRIHFSNIIALWTNHVRWKYFGLVPVRTEYRYIAKTDVAGDIVFDSRGGSAEVGRSIERANHAWKLPRYRQALREGRTLMFGPFELTDVTLRFKRDKLVPWSALRSVEVRGGRVRVLSATERRAWATVPVADIPHCMTFLELTRSRTHSAIAG
jgi:Family of unknown function (DUF6585)